jgi:hypothetical protein
MIKLAQADMEPIPMIAICLKDHLDHEGTEIFDPVEDTHKVGDVGEIFGMYADKEYWEPQHVYELEDIPANAGDWVFHKYVKHPIQVTKVENIGGIDTYFFEGRSHTGHLETCQKVVATTNYSLGLPRIDDEKLKEFLNGSRTR